MCGESLAKCNCVMPDEKMEKRVYILEGLDCANCAAKVEAKIRQMPEVEYASVAYATKQLRVSAPDHTGLMEKMQAAIDAIEDGITLVPRNRKAGATVSKTKVYVLEGLDCPNCAAKIEHRIRTMDGVNGVSITYANKQMRLSASRPDVLIPSIQKAIDAMADGITVVPKEEIKEEAKKRKRNQESQKDTDPWFQSFPERSCSWPAFLRFMQAVWKSRIRGCFRCLSFPI